jgi:phosphoadenosine phosphosulfate reductase
VSVPDLISDSLELINEQLRDQPAQERIHWARETYGDALALSTSFGIQSAVMLHLATRVWPEIPVIFIDTGYLFPETYRFARDLTERLQLNLRKYQPQMSAAEHEALHGQEWEQGGEGLARYNFLRKVEPMNRALTELGTRAWLSGLRRDQASSRKALQVVQPQARIVKVNPIADWTDRDVHRYLTEHDLPYHPLFDQGYVSVGDTHSTTPLLEGMNPEDTRFGGIKRECGLHETTGRVDFQI